jgi:hypothetical protein
MEENKLWLKKAPATIVGVLFIGIICSALYDFLIKPGINRFSKSLFDLLTFGSQKVKDYSFSTAALDPTSTPALFLLLGVLGIFFGHFCGTVAPIYFSSLRKNKSAIESSSKRKIVFHKWITLPALTIFLAAYTYVPVNVFNQAILTWRVFHSNLQIISPHISDKEKNELSAMFASMKNESDHDEIYEKMKRIAEKSKTQLRPERPW